MLGPIGPRAKGQGVGGVADCASFATSSFGRVITVDLWDSYTAIYVRKIKQLAISISCGLPTERIFPGNKFPYPILSVDARRKMVEMTVETDQPAGFVPTSPTFDSTLLNVMNSWLFTSRKANEGDSTDPLSEANRKRLDALNRLNEQEWIVEYRRVMDGRTTTAARMDGLAMLLPAMLDPTRALAVVCFLHVHGCVQLSCVVGCMLADEQFGMMLDVWEKQVAFLNVHRSSKMRLARSLHEVCEKAVARVSSATVCLALKLEDFIVDVVKRSEFVVSCWLVNRASDDFALHTTQALYYSWSGMNVRLRRAYNCAMRDAPFATTAPILRFLNLLLSASLAHAHFRLGPLLRALDEFPFRVWKEVSESSKSAEHWETARSTCLLLKTHVLSVAANTTDLSLTRSAALFSWILDALCGTPSKELSAHFDEEMHDYVGNVLMNMRGPPPHDTSSLWMALHEEIEYELSKRGCRLPYQPPATPQPPLTVSEKVELLGATPPPSPTDSQTNLLGQSSTAVAAAAPTAPASSTTGAPSTASASSSHSSLGAPPASGGTVSIPVSTRSTSLMSVQPESQNQQQSSSDGAPPTLTPSRQPNAPSDSSGGRAVAGRSPIPPLFSCNFSPSPVYDSADSRNASTYRSAFSATRECFAMLDDDWEDEEVWDADDMMPLPAQQSLSGMYEIETESLAGERLVDEGVSNDECETSNANASRVSVDDLSVSPHPTAHTMSPRSSDFAQLFSRCSPRSTVCDVSADRIDIKPEEDDASSQDMIDGFSNKLCVVGWERPADEDMDGLECADLSIPDHMRRASSLEPRSALSESASPKSIACGNVVSENDGDAETCVSFDVCDNPDSNSHQSSGMALYQQTEGAGAVSDAGRTDGGVLTMDEQLCAAQSWSSILATTPYEATWEPSIGVAKAIVPLENHLLSRSDIVAAVLATYNGVQLFRKKGTVAVAHTRVGAYCDDGRKALITAGFLLAEKELNSCNNKRYTMACRVAAVSGGELVVEPGPAWSPPALSNVEQTRIDHPLSPLDPIPDGGRVYYRDCRVWRAGIVVSRDERVGLSRVFDLRLETISVARGEHLIYMADLEEGCVVSVVEGEQEWTGTLVSLPLADEWQQGRCLIRPDHNHMDTMVLWHNISPSSSDAQYIVDRLKEEHGETGRLWNLSMPNPEREAFVRATIEKCRREERTAEEEEE